MTGFLFFGLFLGLLGLVLGEEFPSRSRKAMNIKQTFFVFADCDGTLVHYPDKIPSSEDATHLLMLPPSSTGMRGIISHETLSLVQEIRQRGSAKMIIVSGMRSSTLFNRLPFLPRADAYGKC